MEHVRRRLRISGTCRQAVAAGASTLAHMTVDACGCLWWDECAGIRRGSRRQSGGRSAGQWQQGQSLAAEQERRCGRAAETYCVPWGSGPVGDVGRRELPEGGGASWGCVVVVPARKEKELEVPRFADEGLSDGAGRPYTWDWEDGGGGQWPRAWRAQTAASRRCFIGRQAHVLPQRGPLAAPHCAGACPLRGAAASLPPRRPARLSTLSHAILAARAEGAEAASSPMLHKSSCRSKPSSAFFGPPSTGTIAVSSSWHTMGASCGSFRHSTRSCT